MKRILVFAATAGVLGLLVFRLVEARMQGETEQVQEKVFPVALAAVTTRDVPRNLVLTGNVRPVNTVDVSAKASGRVEEIRADLGDTVSKGDVLAVLEHREAELRVMQARGAFAAADAAFLNAESEYRRTKALEESGAVSESQIDGLRTRMESARAAKLQAEAGLGLAREALKNTSVRAPIDGVVTRRSLEIGQLVTPGRPVYQVQDTAKMKFRAGVSAENFRSVEKGMPVSIFVDGLPEATFDGSVARVSPSLDAYTRRAAIEVEIDNSDGRLLANMFARGVILLGEEKDALTLPSSAILEDGKTQAVFIAKDGRAEKRPVKLKFKNDEFAVLDEGAVSGERIVIRGQELLSNGAQISSTSDSSAAE